MKGFIATLKKNQNNAFYIDIPNKIMQEQKIKPYMTAKIKTDKNKIKIFDFNETKKFKIKLEKEDIENLKKIMHFEGYSSLDETLANTVSSFSANLTGKKFEQSIYIYPKGFLQSKCDLINDYEKQLKKLSKSEVKKLVT